MKRMKVLGSVLATSVLAVTVGCAGQDEGAGAGPKTPPVATADPDTVQPDPVLASDAVKVSVASVQLQDDCPSAAAADAVPSPAKPAAKELPSEPAGDVAPGAARDSARGFAPSCVQSRVQFAIESGSDKDLTFSVKAVRLRKDDATVGEMSTREPSVWEASKYTPWKQSITAGASLKVGYKLGGPDWSKVGKAIGGDTWGPMYTLEIDVEVDGDMRTIVSPKAPRDEPENIAT